MDPLMQALIFVILGAVTFIIGGHLCTNRVKTGGVLMFIGAVLMLSPVALALNHL